MQLVTMVPTMVPTMALLTVVPTMVPTTAVRMSMVMDTTEMPWRRELHC